MKNSHLGSPAALKMVLFLCGVIVAGIAGAILIAPDAAELSYTVAFGRDRQLTGTLRAYAVVLLVAGAAILAGAFRTRCVGLANMTAAAVFLGLGVSQSLALILGGIDEEGALVAAIVEFAIGAISLTNLNDYRKQFRI